jgi:hypothetical protein
LPAGGASLTDERPQRRRRHRGRRRFAVVVALVLALLALGLVAATAGTALDTQGERFLHLPGRAAVPAWTRPCWRHLESRYPYTLPCGRVVGRVVLRQAHDPDGDGDAHLVLAVRLDVVIVKLPPGGDRGVALGDRVRAVGLLSRGRLHRPVIAARAVRAP